MIQFEIPGEAVPWARAGGGKTVFRFTPQKQRNYMVAIQFYAARAMKGHKLFDCALELSIKAVYARPKSHTKRQQASDWKTTKADSDNIAKLVGDAANKIVWLDDAQIARLVVEKIYGDKPRMEVTIKELL